MFLMHFAAALPSVILFWGISYLLMIKRKKVQVRNTVALAHIAGTTTIIALVFSPASRMAAGESSNMVLAALVFSVISCTLLRHQEKKHHEANKQAAPQAEDMAIESKPKSKRSFFLAATLVFGIGVILVQAFTREPVTATVTPKAMTCMQFNALGVGAITKDKILDTPATEVQVTKYKEVIAEYAANLSSGDTPKSRALQLAMKDKQYFTQLVAETLAMTRVFCIERQNDPMSNVAIEQLDYLLNAIAKKLNNQ